MKVLYIRRVSNEPLEEVFFYELTSTINKPDLRRCFQIVPAALMKLMAVYTTEVACHSRVSRVLTKHSTTELYPSLLQILFSFIFPLLESIMLFLI